MVQRRINMNKFSLVTMAWVVGLACNAYAQTYYRWVDPEGNVNYSATPPAEVEQVAPVEIQPGPSDEEVKRAIDRQKRFEAQLGEAQEKRARGEQEREDKLKEAEEAVEQAERDLLEAKKTRGVDYLSGGALAQYQERVQAAEQTLEKAKQELRKLGPGRP